LRFLQQPLPLNLFIVVESNSVSNYDRKICHVRDCDAKGYRIYFRYERRRIYCRKCQSVHMECLEWLADNSRYTKQFANHVGKLCREMTNKAVAELLRLTEHTVKDLDKQYMKQMLAKAPVRAPRVIGVDEISIRKGHDYRIVVSDIERGRPIWVGGKGREEMDMDAFFTALGAKKSKRIRLAVMDMWKAFRNSVNKNAPRAKILFDKFHIMKHLSEAMDTVRREEYKRVSDDQRKFIKGQRYTLLSHRENLTLKGRQSLKELLAVNKSIQTAYLLKEEFGQLWDYDSETWARKFFNNWKEKLKWQRIKPFEKFAAMIEKHWDGIISHCHPENKVKLGFVEGVNNKIRVIQRSAYGYRDEEYFKLKILTAFLPK
jgi:transposase